jgi:hypothetical protein
MWEAFGCACLVVTGAELATAQALVAGYVSALAKPADSDHLRASARLAPHVAVEQHHRTTHRYLPAA